MYKQNNSSQMNTQVETFVIEEVESLIYDNEKLDKWNSIVDNLELQGQRNIVKPDKSPIPFLNMNADLINVFNTLCPRSIDIKSFSVTPIPVEILDLVALAVSEKYFNNIEVWWDDKTPDPVVIGMTGHWEERMWYEDSNKSLKDRFQSKEEAISAGAKHPSFSETGKYLIGKWGDVKHSFETLKEMARKRFIAMESIEFKRKIKEAQRGLDDLEQSAYDRFGV